jgi:hypothetical protein
MKEFKDSLTTALQQGFVPALQHISNSLEVPLQQRLKAHRFAKEFQAIEDFKDAQDPSIRYADRPMEVQDESHQMFLKEQEVFEWMMDFLCSIRTEQP